MRTFCIVYYEGVGRTHMPYINIDHVYAHSEGDAFEKFAKAFGMTASELENHIHTQDDVRMEIRDVDLKERLSFVNGKQYMKEEPEDKDLERARGLSHGLNLEVPDMSKVNKMVKLIKDKAKLVRRAKAVAAVWGTRDYTGEIKGSIANPFQPFAEALLDRGFELSEIYEIGRYEHPDVFKTIGLEELL